MICEVYGENAISYEMVRKWVRKFNKSCDNMHDERQNTHCCSNSTPITSFRWEQFDHLPYRPDLVPSDFHLFLYLKKFLAGQCFLNNDDVKEAVKKWPSS
jgi:hypothetical protein